jgi:hypothetical chaperone protein
MPKFGLDFGTTNSAIAIEKDGVGEVLKIDLKALDPGVVRTLLYMNRREIVYRENIEPIRIKEQIFKAGDFHWEGEFKPLIGQAAVERYLEENKNRKPGLRRIIFTGKWWQSTAQGMAPAEPGRGVEEFYEEVDYGVGRLLQALKTALKSRFYKGTTVFGKYFTLEELISVFISEMKKKAEGEIGEKVGEVVVGRPVHFSDDPVKDKEAEDRLRKALELAGFKKITFEFEPVGAARQFISSQDSGQVEDPVRARMTKLVFVFDFGGGTLDTAIVRGSEVLAADGVYIGGDLLNADIFREKLWRYFGYKSLYGDAQLQVPPHIYEGLNSWYSIPNLNNPDMMLLLDKCKYKNLFPEAIDRLIYLIKMNLGFDLYEQIEKTKKELSFSDQATLEFESGPIQIKEKITREEFEKIIKPRVDEIRAVIFKTLETAGVEAKDIDVVVRTGGSSLIPVFENLLVEIFGKEKIKQFETFTSIASGLSLY